MSTRNFKRNFFIVAGADAVKRIAEWIKQKFYTKAEIDDMLSAGMKYKVVNELPATGETGTFYIVPKQSAGTGDVYDEYIYVDGSFEHIGSTEIDLSNYYTKTQADDLLDDKVDKVNGKGLSTNDFTTTEKNKLSSIENGAEVNVQSDWNQSDSTKDDYIKNKPTLRQPSTDGTAGQYLKSNGSGNAPSWETIDSSPTANSTKAVTSGGVKTALDGKQASVTITTNANTPTDNDTVIMQDNGNTGTTSFLRRKLLTLWEYFKKKPYGEAYLVWGGKNHNANLSPIDANLISEARANRLARYPLQYMKIEDSRDDGVTWTENTNITDLSKHILVTDCEGNASGIRIGGSDASHVADEHCKTRITFTTYGVSSSILYARIEKICLWIETNGTTGNTCTVLGRLQTDVEADNDVWATLGGPATLGGWSDWNVIQTDFTTYGNQNQKSTQYGQFRLLFECIGHDSVATREGLGIQKIRAYGMRCWTAKNSLASYNSFFGIDSSDNATFPANVKASKHITDGGTTSQFVDGTGALQNFANVAKSAVSLNGGKTGFRIIKVDGANYRYLLVLADVTGVYDGTITNKMYGIQGLLFMQRDGSSIYKNLVGRITATASYSSAYANLYTDVLPNEQYGAPCIIKKDGKWLLCLKSGGNNGGYEATSMLFFVRAYELADEPFTKIRVNNDFQTYYDGGASIDYVKNASRFPLWASFGGTASQVVLGTGELKTIDSSVASGSSNLVTSGAVATAIAGVDLSGKVNLQPDFTASQIDYSAGNVGKWQKVLRFPEGADLIINMKKTAMGSDATSTLWFSSSSMGDSYTSLFGNNSVRFVHDGGYVFLVLACRKSTNEPIESYTFQIAHSSVPMSDIVAVTDASPITATPKEPSIVYRAPITTGAVSFNVTSGAGSVYMSGHNDFLGNMTSEATNGVTVTMSGATEGQIYRFVFTRNITGGVTFKQSNVAYCTISGDVNAGDTITLTAVSNTADGWLYEQESAGIESSDGSNIIEYNGSTADVRVNWDKLPANVVRNGAYSSSTGHENIAIGFASSVAPTSYSGAVAIGKSTTSSGNFSIVVGCFSNADNGGMAFGSQAHANGSSSLAVGSNVTANDSSSMAIGTHAESEGFQSIAIGPYASTKNISALAVGYNAKANQLRGGYGKHELISFKVNDVSKKVHTSSTAETISIEITGIGTFTGIDIPTDYMLFVLNEELEFANELLYEVDGVVKQKQNFSSSAWNYITVSRKTALGSSGYYAYIFPSKYIDYTDINTSTNAYFFATSGDSYNRRYNGISIGSSTTSIGSGSIAIGDGATSIKDGQIVLGQFNAESGTDLFQIGNGTESNRKNILTIDSNERLNVSAYVGGTQTIDMNQQTGSLGNITKSIYRIRWDDTGTINLTLDTGGCVEGQRVTIFAETNDVQIRFTSYLIPEGQFADFMFIAGAWRPYSGIGRVPTA